MDIGRALGCGASLVGLRRTGVGPFRVEEAITLEALEKDPVAGRALLRPPEALVEGLARVDASAEDARRFIHGQVIGEARTAAEGTELALFAPGGRFLGVGLGQADGRIAPLRLLAGGNEPRSP